MDWHKKNISFIVISAVVGFMIAIQFQTVKEPVERDTRDIWQLREALLKEKELQSSLLAEIRSIEEKLLAYESERKQSKEQVLRETLDELKAEAGMSVVHGPGITLQVEPEEFQLGSPINKGLSPDLLKRLLNELNLYGGKYIAIDGQRIINTTVIRDINNETKIDGHSLSNLPIEIKVAVDTSAAAEKLYNRMKASKATEEFFIEDLRLVVNEVSSKISVPAYENSIRIRNMELVKEAEGGDG
ncbi:MAG: hypothetical protein K0Q87_1447 [Neobacillus sp.]|nr:hypothetical protein [Neobacillus sp.]